MRILIVEDDESLRDMMKLRLENASYAVDCAGDGATGSFMARTTDYDLVILDLLMPERSGSAVCAELRAAGRTMPILITTVDGGVPKKVELLDLGADDYLQKPFSFDELNARVRALTRRPQALRPDILRSGEVILDVPRCKVTVDGREVYLTRKEFALLEYFMRHDGMLVTRGMMLEHVWDSELDPFSNTIETHVMSLRKKLRAGEDDTQLIRTVPGRGYVFGRPA